MIQLGIFKKIANVIMIFQTLNDKEYFARNSKIFLKFKNVREMKVIIVYLREFQFKIKKYISSQTL